jgi:hypothetical protein
MIKTKYEGVGGITNKLRYFYYMFMYPLPCWAIISESNGGGLKYFNKLFWEGDAVYFFINSQMNMSS